MFDGLIQLFINILNALASAFAQVLEAVFPYELLMTFYTPVNIYLFSDTGWFSEPIPLIDIINMVMFFIAFFLLLRLLFKGTKKFINMIFGVFK
jgi:hypothetical protein